MLAFVAIILVFSFVQARNEPAPTSHLPAPSRPLTNPEPGLAPARTDLGLSDSQRSSIQSIAQKWSAEKAKLLTAMSNYEPKRGRTDQIAGSLQAYSELSRTYDATRAGYWQMVNSLLDKRQQALIAEVSK
jgi:hypothetical protein